MGAGQPQPEESITASLFGQSVAAKGTSAIIMLVLLVFAAGMGYMLWERSNDARLMMITVNAELSKHAFDMSNDHKALLQATENLISSGSSTTKQLKIQNYIILAEPSEKAEIKKKLGRPAELQ